MGETSSIDVIYVPLIYSGAMGIDAIAALIFGMMYDKIGTRSLQIAMSLAMLFAPIFFFANNTAWLLVGIALWGVGMGAQESILKSVVSTIVSKDKRATAYGIFSSVFGLAWFAGSAIIGAIYPVSITYVVVFSVVMEVIAVVFLVVFERFQKRQNR